MINGEDQILYIRTSTLQAFEPVGCLSSNSLSEESETINTTTRDNNGWMTIIPQRQRYNVSFSGLVEKERVLNRLTYSDLANIKRLEKKILWKVVGGEETIIGSGYIQTLEDNSEVESMVGFSATIVGTGRTYLGSDARVSELRGQLNGFSTFNGLLRDIRAFIPLYGRLSGASQFLGNLESAIEYLLLQGNLNGQSLFLAELKKFINLKRLEGSLNGESLFNGFISIPTIIKLLEGSLNGESVLLGEVETFKQFKELRGQYGGNSFLIGLLKASVNFKVLEGALNGASNFNAILTEVYSVKTLSAVYNIDYDVDAYIQRVISNGGKIESYDCLIDFIGAFTNSGGIVGTSLFDGVLEALNNFQQLSGSVNGASNFSGGLTKVFTQKLLSAVNNIDYDLDSYIQRVISSGGDIEDASCLDEFVGEFTDSGGLDGITILRAVLTKIEPTEWIAFDVDNNGVSSANNACFIGLSNDIWYTPSTSIAVGSNVYSSQSTSNPVNGGNLWYFVDDTINFAIRVNNNGQITDISPCSL